MSDNDATKEPLILCIIDGWGERAEVKHNAMRQAHTPCLDALRDSCPSVTLAASAEAVGLQPGRPGDGELGHRTLAAGRVLPPVRASIDEIVRPNHIGRNEMVDRMLRLCMYNEYTLHLFGLLSDVNRHADLEHLFALIEVADFNEIPVVVHAFTDGRDAGPRATMDSLRMLDHVMDGKKATLGTISGRYYAMDRGLHWDRTYKAFHAIVRDVVLGEAAPEAETAFEAVSWAYQRGLNDDMIPPTRIGGYGGIKGEFMCDFAAKPPEWQWHAEAAGMFVNIRGDRAHQLAAMMTREVPAEIADDLLVDRRKPVVVFEDGQLATLTRYSDKLNAIAGFGEEPVADSLGEVLALTGLKQLRCAETEGRAYVSTFFNGGRAEPFAGEDRIIVPSPQFADRYEETPAMSAAKIAATVAGAIAENKYDFILLHFANLDELGHGGDLAATIKGAEAVDAALAEIVAAVRQAGGSLLITSSHGNCEQMKDELGEAHVAHTTNPVPLIYLNDKDDAKLRSGGSLADVAPTVLDVLGIEPPASMTGRTLRMIPS